MYPAMEDNNLIGLDEEGCVVSLFRTGNGKNTSLGNIRTDPFYRAWISLDDTL